MNRYRKSRGFTLIELMVVISIIGVMSTTVLSSLSKARSKARDTKRVTEIKQLQTALELYFNDNGRYPDGDNAGCGGWDTPGNGTFLSPVASGGYMPNILDPTTNDTCGNYRYYRYPPGYSGCDASKNFYVLMIIGFESFSGTHPSSPGFSCASRNWSAEGSYVVGKYEG